MLRDTFLRVFIDEGECELFMQMNGFWQVIIFVTDNDIIIVWWL